MQRSFSFNILSIFKINKYYDKNQILNYHSGSCTDKSTLRFFTITDFKIIFNSTHRFKLWFLSYMIIIFCIRYCDIFPKLSCSLYLHLWLFWQIIAVFSYLRIYQINSIIGIQLWAHLLFLELKFMVRNI